MKVGDLVRHRKDGDIGLVLAVGGDYDDYDSSPELYEIQWVEEGPLELRSYGTFGSDLEVISASR